MCMCVCVVSMCVVVNVAIVLFLPFCVSDSPHHRSPSLFSFIPAPFSMIFSPSASSFIPLHLSFTSFSLTIMLVHSFASAPQSPLSFIDAGTDTYTTMMEMSDDDEKLIQLSVDDALAVVLFISLHLLSVPLMLMHMSISLWTMHVWMNACISATEMNCVMIVPPSFCSRWDLSDGVLHSSPFVHSLCVRRRQGRRSSMPVSK